MTDIPFDPKLPVMKRDGRKARIICEDRVHDRPIIALYTNAGGGEFISHHRSDGRSSQNQTSPNDLINVPRTFYLNIYASRENIASVHWSTRLDADNAAVPRRIACVKVTEGEFHD